MAKEDYFLKINFRLNSATVLKDFLVELRDFGIEVNDVTYSSSGVPIEIKKIGNKILEKPFRFSLSGTSLYRSFFVRKIDNKIFLICNYDSNSAETSSSNVSFYIEGNEESISTTYTGTGTGTVGWTTLYKAFNIPFKYGYFEGLNDAGLCFSAALNASTADTTDRVDEHKCIDIYEKNIYISNIPIVAGKKYKDEDENQYLAINSYMAVKYEE